MDLYFAPLSCSLASRIALYESNQAAGFHPVTLSTRTLADGSDYLAINPKGQVPALRIADGSILTEGAAVLQYIADQAPESGLAPGWGTAERYQLQSWLSYIGSEIHKQIYYPIFNPASPPEARTFAREVAAPPRYDYLAAHLAKRDFLVGDRFTVADAYLTTTLNWAQPGGVDLSRWPAITAYHARNLARPAVARALADDLAARS
jgi:glutathione S-transferase